MAWRGRKPSRSRGIALSVSPPPSLSLSQSPSGSLLFICLRESSTASHTPPSPLLLPTIFLALHPPPTNPTPVAERWAPLSHGRRGYGEKHILRRPTYASPHARWRIINQEGGPDGGLWHGWLGVRQKTQTREEKEGTPKMNRRGEGEGRRERKEK